MGIRQTGAFCGNRSGCRLLLEYSEAEAEVLSETFVKSLNNADICESIFECDNVLHSKKHWTTS